MWARSRCHLRATGGLRRQDQSSQGGEQQGRGELAEKDKLENGLVRLQHLDQGIGEDRHHVAEHQIEDAYSDCIHTTSRFR